MYMRGLEHDPFNFSSTNSTDSTPNTNRPYGNSIVLNEVHELFPALLYDSEQFHTVNQIFNYVQSRMNQRFNVFNAQTNAYRQRTGRRGRQRTVQQVPVRPMNVPISPRLNSESPSPSPVRISSNDLINLFTIAMMEPTVPVNFSDPVPVVPSVHQLETGSRVRDVLQNLENPCAVCQDSMITGQTVRIINACEHTFHTSCIDTWFQRNVHCPVCRHDIRIT